MQKAGAGAAAVILIAFLYCTTPPRSFIPIDVTVAPGALASGVAEELQKARVITHPRIFRAVLRLSGGSAGVKAGTYRFSRPESVLTVAYRLRTGAYDMPPVRVTFPEGLTVREMAARVSAAFPHVPQSEFLAEASTYEGYLFPDTYFFSSAATSSAIVRAMRKNFDEKLEPLMGDISASGRSLSQVIIMASIIEKEARTKENKELVAGVLWNRIDRSMPLQVDAVFGYIFKRDTYHPSIADLKVDSPYNTYLHYGLPPGPINNPGLESIKAALYPTKTEYLFYLTGSDDLMHYARTYAEHQTNLRQYLR